MLGNRRPAKLIFLLHFISTFIAPSVLNQPPDLHHDLHWDDSGYQWLGEILKNEDEIRHSDLKTIEKIHHGIDRGSNRTLLHWCAHFGAVKFCQKLLRMGEYQKLINLATNDTLLETPLHRAAVRSQTQIATLFVRQGADLEATRFDGRTALLLASNLETAAKLVQLGANYRHVDANGFQPIHIAVVEKHRELVEYYSYLMNRKYAETSQILANLSISNGRIVRINEFAMNTARGPVLFKCNRGFSLARKPSALWNPVENIWLLNGYCFKDEEMLERSLKQAVVDGSLSKVELYLDQGANMDAKGGANELTALHEAVKAGSLDITRLLLNRGANLEAETKNGERSLHLVASNNPTRVEIVALLLNRGANVEVGDAFGRTVLHLAASKGAQNLVELLLSNKGRRRMVNSIDNVGATALHLAVKFGHLNITKSLVDRGADLNVLSYSNNTDCSLSTPLVCAIKRNNTDVARYLLSKGAAVPKIEVSNGTVPDTSYRMGDSFLETTFTCDSGFKTGGSSAVAWWAPDESQWRMKGYCFKDNASLEDNLRAETVADRVRSLLGKGVNIDAKDKDGKTALHWAAFRGDSQIVALLLNRGATLEAKCSDGKTALHHAAWKGHPDVARLLISRGAVVNAVTRKGLTPLMYAAFEGYLNVVEVLVERGRASLDVVSWANKSFCQSSTAVTCAAKQIRPHVVKYLRDKGASTQGCSYTTCRASLEKNWTVETDVNFSEMMFSSVL